MSSAVYSVDYRHSNGNMHIGVSGEFTAGAAEAVLDILQKAYTGSGRIFIDTLNINSVAESGAEYFKQAFVKVNLPAANLFFKGEKGRSIGPNGSKLIILKAKEKKQCCGKCKNCSCKNHHTHHNHHSHEGE